jgi:acyl carrier protein
LEETYIAPRSPTEEILAGIWTEVLKLKQVGTRDNFFALGGHSLLATQVISRVRKAFQLDLPLRTIFENPTVEALARVTGENLSERGGGEEVARILGELNSLSEDEARRLIAEESGKPSRGERRD